MLVATKETCFLIKVSKFLKMPSLEADLRDDKASLWGRKRGTFYFFPLSEANYGLLDPTEMSLVTCHLTCITFCFPSIQMYSNSSIQALLPPTFFDWWNQSSHSSCCCFLSVEEPHQPPDFGLRLLFRRSPFQSHGWEERLSSSLRNMQLQKIGLFYSPV